MMDYNPPHLAGLTRGKGAVQENRSERAREQPPWFAQMSGEIGEEKARLHVRKFLKKGGFNHCK